MVLHSAFIRVPEISNDVQLVKGMFFLLNRFNPAPRDPLSCRVYLQPYSNKPEPANQGLQDHLKNRMPGELKQDGNKFCPTVGSPEAGLKT